MNEFLAERTPNLSPPAIARIAEILNCSPEDITLHATDGGYSKNIRAVAECDDKYIFAKEVDTSVVEGDGAQELHWLKKDYQNIQWIAENYPEIVAERRILTNDNSLLLLSAYRPEDGWLWMPPRRREEQVEYVDAVLHAVQKLGAVHYSDETIESLEAQPFLKKDFERDGGMAKIAADAAIREAGAARMATVAESKTNLFVRKSAEQLQVALLNESAVEDLTTCAAAYQQQPETTLGHADVRSDNLAFHPETKQVKLVDWNWMSLTTEKSGYVEFLCDMARRGIDVAKWRDWLDKDMLAAVTGYYLNKCMKPDVLGGNLRTMQAETAAVAYGLYQIAP